MGPKTFFFTQLASVLVYVGTLVGLYALLVKQKDATIGQKDATIQLLKERIDALQKDLDKAKNEAPDMIMKRLDERIRIVNGEIERLSKDQQVLERMNELRAEYIEIQKKLIESKEIQVHYSEELFAIDDQILDFIKQTMIELGLSESPEVSTLITYLDMWKHENMSAELERERTLQEKPPQLNP